MRHGRVIVCVLTLIFLAVAVFVGVYESGGENFPFSVILSSDNETERICCWKNIDKYYVFLPSYAELSQARLHANKIYKIIIDSQPIVDGMTCENFPLNTPLPLSYSARDGEHNCTVIFVQSGNVPTMYIDVPSGSMEYIHEKKGNSEAGTMRLYSAEGVLEHHGDLESIKGRGNSTWEDEKKPYSLTLRQEADLLGMGKASKWILLANSGDYSHLRNKISFDIAKEVNLPYSPECTWTDLYLNGEYAGLYLLCERNEVHPQRINIDSDSSFLVSVEPGWRLQMQGYPYVVTDSAVALRIHHSSMEMDAVRRIWQSAENAILAEDGVDPQTGKIWDELIDVDSWVRKYLIEEIFANIDSCLASEFFFYEEADGKIYAGPIWDMDVILESGSLESLSPRAILAGRPHLWNETDSPFFYYALLQKEKFYGRMVELYQQEFHPLLMRLLDSGLEQYGQQTVRAAAANKMRWPVGDASENIDRMRTYLMERMQFLDDYWVNKETYYLVQAQHGAVWAFAVLPGEVLDYLPVFEGEAWYIMDTDEPFDRTVPVNDDIAIYSKPIAAEAE